jgi:hypothetical protein
LYAVFSVELTNSCLEYGNKFVVAFTIAEILEDLYSKFQLTWLNGFREDLKKLTNHKQELPMVAILVV